jgi:uncharacterized membrane protein
LELVVFVASLKFFFIEGGEQFIVGAQTAKTIGLKPTLKITLAGVSLPVILFFLLFYSHALIPTRWLEFALAITLYFFAATMFKEAFEKESDDETKELDEKAHKYGYITIVSLVCRECNRFGCIDFHRYKWCIDRSFYLYFNICRTRN